MNTVHAAHQNCKKTALHVSNEHAAKTVACMQH